MQRSEGVGVFGPIGLSAAEEAAYRYLVGRPQVTVEQVADGAELKYDEAFEPLLRERQHEVDMARTAVERLLAVYKVVPRGGSVDDVLEIVEGRPAAERRFDQLYESTRRSNESFVKPPLLVRGVETEHEPFLSTVSYKVV